MTAEKNNDQLTMCPRCNCDGCYVTPINETKNNYFCWGCGFQTNDLMKEGEFDFEAFEEALPELYKDLKNADSEGRIWYPISINIPNKGTVFISGPDTLTAVWSAIKVIPLTEEEKQEPKYRGMTHKSDAKSLKHFGYDFIEACDYIELFEQ